MDKEVIKELGVIGIKKTARNVCPNKGYAVVTARSNPRCWLIPLDNSRATISGLALFQPLLLSARMMKLAASMLSFIGLSRLWARERVYLDGHCRLERLFPHLAKPMYAFFTGTTGPHRKLAVQIMDQRGHIECFAKVSVNPQVESLLRHEAAMLEVVGCLKLQNANTPSLLYAGQCNGATLLVTDTLKTLFTRSVTKFTQAHKIFLDELADKTQQSSMSVSSFEEKFKSRLSVLLSRVGYDWKERLTQALYTLENNSEAVIPCCLSHGDFTPWNTFVEKGKLYVFDWEYADICAPQANDLIHFLLNQPRVRNKSAEKKLSCLRNRLEASNIAITSSVVDAAIIIYLLDQVLRQLERIPEKINPIIEWDSMCEQAALLDLLIAERVECS